MANFNWADGFAQSNFPAEWLATKGAGIRIAVIDTGFNLPPALLESLKKKGKIFNTDLGQPVEGGDGEVNLIDGSMAAIGHGTPCLSIVGAKKVADSTGNLITGLAPSADFLLIKAARTAGGNLSWKHLLDGLKIALDKKAQIVVTGYGLLAADRAGLPDAEIEAVFARVREAGMLIIGTWANASDTENWKGIVDKYWPANRPETIAAGRMPATNLAARLGEVKLTPEIDVLVERQMPGSVFSKTGLVVPISKTSNSFAAYIFAGGLANMLAFFKKNPLPGQAVMTWDKKTALVAFAAGCRTFSQATGTPQTMNFYRNQ